MCEKAPETRPLPETDAWNGWTHVSAWASLLAPPVHPFE